MNSWRQKTCAGCGASFSCGAQSSDHACWCADLPSVAIDDPDSDCLCSNCLSERISLTATPTAQANASLREPQPLRAEDYYMEGERMVFTKAYHLKSGYCCESNCRHCPFEFTRFQK